MKTIGLISILIVAAGCGDIPTHPKAHDPWAAGDAEEVVVDSRAVQAQWNGRFVGRWMVDQPNHATYEATFYELMEDGQVLQGSSVDWGGNLERHGETGSVTQAANHDLFCTFGDTWRSEGENTLVIDGECSDGHPRPIVLGLDSDPTNNSVRGGVTIKIVSVGDEADWFHDNFEWVFTKCEAGQTEQSCMGWDFEP